MRKVVVVGRWRDRADSLGAKFRNTQLQRATACSGWAAGGGGPRGQRPERPTKGQKRVGVGHRSRHRFAIRFAIGQVAVSTQLVVISDRVFCVLRVAEFAVLRAWCPPIHPLQIPPFGTLDSSRGALGGSSDPHARTFRWDWLSFHWPRVLELGPEGPRWGSKGP